jgi:hypothetical protein
LAEEVTKVKKFNKTILGKVSTIVGAIFALVIPVIPAQTSTAIAPGTRTVTVSLAAGDKREDRGDVVMTFNVNDLTGVSFKSRNRRYPGLKVIDLTRSAVTCEAKDAEYGSVKLKDGSWIAVAFCPDNPSTTAIAIPSLIRARASANEASAGNDPTEMTCFENKELKMGVCFKASANPAAKPMPQTREHILLARQVG